MGLRYPLFCIRYLRLCNYAYVSSFLFLFCRPGHEGSRTPGAYPRDTLYFTISPNIIIQVAVMNSAFHRKHVFSIFTTAVSLIEIICIISDISRE